MTKEEIDSLILEGKPLEAKFFPRKIWFSLGGNKITEKQFDAAKKRFEGRLDCKADFSGLTTHTYTIKQIK